MKKVTKKRLLALGLILTILINTGANALASEGDVENEAVQEEVSNPVCELCNTDPCSCPPPVPEPVSEPVPACEICNTDPCICPPPVPVCEICNTNPCSCPPPLPACEICNTDPCSCPPPAPACEICNTDPCICADESPEEPQTVCGICGEETCICVPEEEFPVICEECNEDPCICPPEICEVCEKEICECEPEPIVLTTEVEGTLLTLTGPATSFEENKTYRIEASIVEAEEEIEAIEEALEEVATEKAKIVESYQAFDIKIMAANEDGTEEEFQPLGPVMVTFSGEDVASSVENEETETNVLHVDTATGETEDMGATATEENDVAIETTHFSIYVFVDLANIGEVTLTVEHWIRTNLEETVYEAGNPATIVLPNGFVGDMENLLSVCVYDEYAAESTLEKIYIQEDGSFREVNDEEQLILTEDTTLKVEYLCDYEKAPQLNIFTKPGVTKLENTIKKDKTATSLDEKDQTNVTLSVSGDESNLGVDIIYIVGRSISREEIETDVMLNCLMDTFAEIIEQGTQVNFGMVPYAYTDLIVLDLTPLRTKEDLKALPDLMAKAFKDADINYDAVNMENALVKAKQMFANSDLKNHPERQHLVMISSGHTYFFNGGDNNEYISTVPVRFKHGTLDSEAIFYMEKAWMRARINSTNSYPIPLKITEAYNKEKPAGITLWEYYWNYIDMWARADIAAGDVGRYDVATVASGNGSIAGAYHSNQSSFKYSSYGKVVQNPSQERLDNTYVFDMKLGGTNYGPNPLVYADAAHAISYERAMWESYEFVKSDITGAGINFYPIYQPLRTNGTATNGDTTYYNWTDQFIGHCFVNMLAGGKAVTYSTTDDKAFFDPIKRSILYSVSAGSYVEDYIGYNRPDPGDFDFIQYVEDENGNIQDVNEIIKLTYRDKTYHTTMLETPNAGATATYKFQAPDKNEPTFTLDYYYGNGTTTERFVWTFGEDISKFVPVTLTYKLQLKDKVEKATQKTTFTVDTNLSATLYPINSEDHHRNPEAFPVPNVEYEVTTHDPSICKEHDSAMPPLNMSNVTPNTAEPSLHMDKTVAATDDPNEFELMLETYVTGSEVFVPLDIVLVLDRSGSMGQANHYLKVDDPVPGYTYYNDKSVNYGLNGYASPITWCDDCQQWVKKHLNKSTGKLDKTKGKGGYEYVDPSTTQFYETNIQATELSIRNFINQIIENGNKNNVDHRVAVVGYGCSSTSRPNATLYIGGNALTYTYNQEASISDANYKKAFVNLSSDSVEESLEASIKKYSNIPKNDYGYATNTHSGLQLAQMVLKNKASVETDIVARKEMVVLFADGAPGVGKSLYGMGTNTSYNWAEKAMDNADALKGDDVTVFTIGFYNNASADPANMIASSKNTSEDIYYKRSNYLFNDIASPGKFYAAQGADALRNAFVSVFNEMDDAAYALGGTTVLREQISKYFVLDCGCSGNTHSCGLQAYTSDYLGKDEDGEHVFSTTLVPVDPEVVTTSVVTVPATETDPQMQAISVTGFDYENHAIIENSDTPTGKKLVLKVPIETRHGFWGGNNVPTNNTTTALYELKDDTVPYNPEDGLKTLSEIKKFPMPEANVPMAVYLSTADKTIYYAGEVTSADLLEKITAGYSEDANDNWIVPTTPVTVNEDGTLVPQESWMDDYAVISWAQNSTAWDAQIDNRECASYDYAVEMSAKEGKNGLTNLSTDPSNIVGAPATLQYTIDQSLSSASDTGNVHILVPVMSFQDTEVSFGYSATKEEYDANNKLAEITWVHKAAIDSLTEEGALDTLDKEMLEELASDTEFDGETEVDVTTEPTLLADTYSPYERIWTDTPVDVTALAYQDRTDVSSEELMSVTTFMWNTCESSMHDEDTIITHKAADGYEFWLHTAELYELPSTGGIGTYWYTISGVALMMCASWLICIKKRKETRGSR